MPKEHDPQSASQRGDPIYEGQSRAKDSFRRLADVPISLVPISAFSSGTETGLSPGGYLRRVRMEKARHLPGDHFARRQTDPGDRSYTDTSNFVRDFRRYFASTPPNIDSVTNNSPVNDGKSES